MWTGGQNFMQGKARQACGLAVRVWKSGPRAAAFTHSRRREFCCLEPAAGGWQGGRGGVSSHLVCCGGSPKLFGGLAGRVFRV